MNYLENVAEILDYDIRNMAGILEDKAIADLLNGDVSDVEEFDEGDVISYENLDEVLFQLPDTIEVSIFCLYKAVTYIIYFCTS